MRSSRPAAVASATSITTQTADGRRVTWVYATDPDGNLVELQAWSAASDR